jgi:hypothetical protein
MTELSNCSIITEPIFIPLKVNFIFYSEIGAKFNAIDLQSHILAAAYGNKIVFWDIRKMKQRAEFTESFND